jgi:hypothetical protein
VLVLDERVVEEARGCGGEREETRGRLTRVIISMKRQKAKRIPNSMIAAVKVRRL